MDKKEKKSGAELAREERKARIEKTTQAQADKKEKKANQSASKKRAKIIVPVVVIVLVLALALCYFFGVPHRMFTAVTLDDGTEISVAEYEYYYMSLYNNYMETALQYEQYYGAYYGEGAGKMMTGFDFSKTPENQEFKAPSAETALDEKVYGKNPTWGDYIEHETIKTCQAFEAFANAAKDAGYKLSEADKKEIDSYIKKLETTAAQNNYSIDAYVRENYGRGMTISLLREILEKQMLVSGFLESKQTEYTDGVTDKQILDVYNKSPNDYNLVNLRFFTFSSEVAKNTDKTTYTDEQLAEMTKKDTEKQKSLADKFFAEAKGENFTKLTAEYAKEEDKTYFEDSDNYSKLADSSYSNVSTYIGEDVAKWAYDSARKVGDKKLFEVKNDDGTADYTIVLLSSLPARDDTKQPVDVRHILFATEEKTTDEATGETKTTQIRTKEEAKKLAEDTLAAWIKSGAKEDEFIKLAAEKSDDPGSSDNGGLYEDVSKSSSYVQPFLDWCFEAGRKEKDYGIIETEFGYHIMYMSSISDTTQWQADIKKQLATDAFNKYYEKISADKKFNATLSGFFGKRVRSRNEDYAARVISNVMKQMNATVPATTPATSAPAESKKTSDK